MAVLFFDTSALVKRYDRNESSSARVRALCRASSGHIVFVSRVAAVEVASAFNRKLREGAFTLLRRDQAWRLFQAHCRRQYGIIAADEPIWSRAQRLPFIYPLRALDAVQLASALRVGALVGALTSEIGFCTADRSQARAASQEGLAVEVIP